MHGTIAADLLDELLAQWVVQQDVCASLARLEECAPYALHISSSYLVEWHKVTALTVVGDHCGDILLADVNAVHAVPLGFLNSARAMIERRCACAQSTNFDEVQPVHRREAVVDLSLTDRIRVVLPCDEQCRHGGQNAGEAAGQHHERRAR